MAKKEEPIVSIGKKIKDVRTEKKITLDRVANDTGYSVEYLKELESGEKIPPVGTLLQIARALDIESGFFPPGTGGQSQGSCAGIYQAYR